MGIVYTTLIQDDFDWNYIGKDKKSILKQIQKEFKKIDREPPVLLGEWYGFMVLDCHKTEVWMDEYKVILLRYCDTAHYWDDNNPYEVKKLEIKKV